MKAKQVSFNQLILLLSLCAGFVFSIAILLSLALQTQRLMQSQSDKMAKTQLELFSENVTQDILTGSYAEVFRKCRALSSSRLLSQVTVRLSGGREICDIESPSDTNLRFIDQKIYFDEAKRSPLADIRMGFKSLSLIDIMFSSLSWGLWVALVASAIMALLNFLLFSRMLSGFVEFVTSVSKLELVTRESLRRLRSSRKRLFEIKEKEELFAQVETLTNTIFSQQESLVDLKVEAVKTGLARQVAHDIRSPLTALNLMVSSIKDLPTEQRQMILEATSRISRIADDLLNKANSDTRTRETVATILRPLSREKSLEFKEKFPTVELEFDFAKVEEQSVQVNRVLLQRALSNLINNAAEACSVGGQVQVAVRALEQNIKISVRDNGCGIPKHVLEELGQKRISHGKDGRGNGIGVLSAKKAIEEMGGRMTVNSSEGHGTSVEILLPKMQLTLFSVPKLSV